MKKFVIKPNEKQEIILDFLLKNFKMIEYNEDIEITRENNVLTFIHHDQIFSKTEDEFFKELSASIKIFEHKCLALINNGYLFDAMFKALGFKLTFKDKFIINILGIVNIFQKYAVWHRSNKNKFQSFLKEKLSKFYVVKETIEELSTIYLL